MTGSTRPDARPAGPVGRAPVGAAPVAEPRAVGSASRWQVLGPVAAAVVGTIVAWGTYYAKPLGPDEGGYLMVARQWSPGSSLYGNYWVDRPPLLIELFSLAGGPLGLRLIGLCAVIISVLLAARVGRLVAPGYRRAPAWTAVTAATFLSSPLFGTHEVNGEMLTVPFVLGGLVAALQAFVHPDPRRAACWWFVAGALGVGAAMVKQNMLDVFVVMTALAATTAARRSRRDALLPTGCFLVGAASAAAAVLLLAASRGTGFSALWDAMVTFRFDAAAKIQAASTTSTPDRALHLVIAAAAAGALPVLGALVATLVDRRVRPERGALPAIPGPALAVALLGWETIAIVGGGSYWLHYLIGLVPGLVLAVAVVVGHSARSRAWVRGAVAYALAATMLSVSWAHLVEPSWNKDLAVEDYLQDHSRPGDTGVVAFGNPNVLEAAGLSSPYENIWSLPVRVRDPRLAEFSTVLAGPHRPTWVVVNGSSLATWGVNARAGDFVLNRLYRPVSVLDGFTVYLVDTRPTG